ncbi:MAG: hypothetical protein ACT4N4_17605 [Rhodospirillales bacterium]
MEGRQAFRFIATALIGLAALVVSAAFSAPALAQSKTAPPAATFTPPPKITVMPQQPKPDYTRLYNVPTTNVPEIPDRPSIKPESGTTGGQTGDRGNLNQLSNVSSIGQLLALPTVTDPQAPSAVLHKLENRLPLGGPAGQAGAAPVAVEGRTGALQALDNAKPIL